MSIFCKLGKHNWKNVKRHFYAEQGFGNHFITHWQLERKCKRCGRVKKPDWFNSSWRIEHPILKVAFLEIDWPNYFNPEEFTAFKETIKFVGNY